MTLSSCQLRSRYYFYSIVISILVWLTLVDFSLGARPLQIKVGAAKAPTWIPLKERENFVKFMNSNAKFSQISFLMQRTSPGKLSGADMIQSMLAATGVTVFLPTDTAFNALDAPTKTKLRTGDFAYLQAVLLFQVVGAKLTGTELAGLKRGATLLTKYKGQLLQKIETAASPVILFPVGRPALLSPIVVKDAYLPATGSMSVQGMGRFLLPTYP